MEKNIFLKEWLPVRQKKEILENIRRNWLFPLSALAFFCLSMDNARGYIPGMFIAFFLALLYATQCPSVKAAAEGDNRWLRGFCALSALGVCLVNQEHFYKLTQKLEFPEAYNVVFLAISYVGAVAALWFVYIVLSVFWKQFFSLCKRHRLTEGICRTEIIVYALCVALMLAFTVYAFLGSKAFYVHGTIYIGDAPGVVGDNAYLVLTHYDNDLRQPLFAAFAAPFTALPCLIARVLGAGVVGRAIALNSVQMAVLYAGHFLIAKMMGLDGGKRLCFVLLNGCTYTHMLFALMMEQYIFAYFWLALCLCLIAENRAERFAFYGAGGTLLTGMALLPFMSRRSPVKEFGAWFTDVVKCGLGFVAMLLVLGRFDALYNVFDNLRSLNYFTGEELSFYEKAMQYFEFVRNCLLVPNAGENTALFHGVLSWQLKDVTDIDRVGAVILLLSVVSALWNREKKSSRLAIYWVGFSVLVLLIIGWGTYENGLILYALYFGWAFLVLLWQLVEKLGEVLGLKFLLPLLSLGGAAALACISLPAIWEMVVFAFTNYPV